MRSSHLRGLAAASGLLLSSTLFAWSNGWIGASAPASTPKPAIESAPELAATCTLPDDPDAPQAFAASPGNWTNPNRYGTGWSMSFYGSGATRQLLVTWHTFSASGKPVWLQSDMLDVTTLPSGEERWSSELFQPTYNYATHTVDRGLAVGKVWLTFPDSSATRAAVRWRWNRYSTTQTFDECIYDIHRGLSRGVQPQPNIVNPAYTANWYDQYTSGWGIDLTVGQIGSSKVEQSLFDIYDQSGKATWLATQTVSTSWPSNGWTTDAVFVSKFNYDLITDCSADTCRTATLLSQPASSYSRAFTTANKGVVQLKINTTGISGAPSVVWPPAAPNQWPAAPAGDLSGCASGATCRPIWRGTDIFTVMVAQTSCTVPSGLTQCPIDVSWVVPSGTTPTPQIYRVDANTLASTFVTSGGSGQVSDRINAGTRAYYELRQNTTVLATTPIVQAYGEQAPATPPSPLVPAIPAEDVASTAVGYTPGTMRVDENGNATYSVPIAVPPGRGGLVPKLAVGYSSGAGDGVAGWGASLDGLSVISRCRFSVEAGDGTNAPMTMWSDSHSYCLDGQRLIRVSQTQTEGALNTEYRTEIDGIRRVVITGVEQVAPNGAGRAITQPTGFEVRSKDGTISRYGTGTARRKAIMTAWTGTLSTDYTVDWWLASTADTVGNTVTYAYNENMANPVANGTIYLTSVSWVGGRVELDYSLRPAPAYSYAAWTARVSLDRWLEKVTVRSATNTTLHWYDLQYEALPQNASLKRLSAVLQCATLSTCFEPTVFDWYDPPSATAAELVESPPVTTNFQDVRAFKYGDIDGDGRADIVSLNRSGGLQINFSRKPATGTGITVSAPVPVMTHCELGGNECFDPNYEGYSRSWALLDFNADGRDDLLIYTGNAWRVRLSNGSTFTTSGEYVLTNSTGAVPGQAPSAFVADFDGDGLPDVLTYDAATGPNTRAWLLRRTGQVSSPYAFSGPHTVRYPLFGNCTLGQMIAFEGGRSEAIDFNGDGRSDFAARTRNGNCLASSTQNQQRPANEVPDWATIQAENPDDSMIADVNAVTAMLTYTSLGLNATTNELEFSAATKILGVLPDASPSSVQFGDINGDGNADFLWRNTSNQLFYTLGVGAGKFAIEHCARAGCPVEPSGKDVRLIDFDGDGRLDLWRQNGANNYVVNVWTSANQFDATEITTFHHGGDDTWMRGFADLDGDGFNDSIIMRHTQVGAAWKINRSTGHHQPRGPLKSIGHGLGAVNVVEYAPLTFGTLYQREYNAHQMVSGRGSPVQDALLPRFVVSRLGTSAPIESNPDALIYTQYRYAGLKMQGGGRGSLGFRVVYSLANGVQTMTEYNQAFPLTGTPKLTQSRPGTWSHLPQCTDPDSTACMLYGGYGSGVAGVIYTSSNDTWAYRTASGTVNGTLTTPEPIQIYRTRSTTTKSDSHTGFLSAEATDFGAYDAYGNLLSSDSRNYSDLLMTTEIRRVTTTNAYTQENPTAWILGRLSESTVTTTRPGTAAVSRKTIFNYMPNGLLGTERVQTVPNVDASTLTTAHTYDAYGNEVRKTTCGGTAGLLVSCSLVQPSGITFRSSSAVAVQRQKRVEFDANGLYPVRNLELFTSPGVPVDSNGTNEVAVATVNARDSYGTPTNVAEANGKVTFTATDAFGRRYFGGSTVGESVLVTRRWCRTAARPSGVYCPAGAAYRVQTTSAGAPPTWAYSDRLDREVLTVRQGFQAGEYVAVQQFYDHRNRKAKTAEPYFTFSPDTASIGQANGVSIYWTQLSYDALDRVAQIQHPNGSTTDIANSGTETVTTLPANTEGVRETKTQRVNALGEVVQIVDHVGSRIDLVYDAAGNVVSTTRVTSAATVVSTAIYDALGRKTAMSDPDAGTWNYSYNAIGEETQRWSAATCATTRYDGRGRAYDVKAYANSSCTGTPDTTSTFGYDTSANGLGMPGVVTNQEAGQPLQTRTHSYDAYGRAISTVTAFDGKTYEQRATFDQYGRAFQTFFQGGAIGSSYIPPSGELFEYNAQGYRTIVRDAYPGLAGDVYSEVFALDARGNVVSERRANNVSLDTTRAYQASTGRLTSILTGGGALQALSYSYDALGNQAGRNDYSGGLSRVERAHYDALQRLTSLETQQPNGAFLLTQGFGYDGLGNLTSGTYDRTLQPLCNGANEVAPGPGAMTRIGTNQFCFDTIGNLVRTMDPNNVNMFGVATVEKRRLVYAPFNQMREIHSSNPFTTATIKFVYGPERQRLRMQEYENVQGTGTPARTVIYAGDAEIITAGTSTVRDVRRHVGGVVITRRINGDGTVASTKRSYVFTDAQGSTHRLVDSNGAVLDAGGIQAFTPFGARAAADTGLSLPGMPRFGFDTSVTSQGYTGHEQLDKVGIIHMGGRIYDPVLGRFLQADPFVQDPGNLQNLNRYSYVNNNPLSYTDPTGYWGQQQQGYLRQAVAIAIAIWSGGAASSSSTWTFMGLKGSSAVLAGGFASGAVATGNLRGAVTGAFSAMVGHSAGGMIVNGKVAQGVFLSAASGGVTEGMNGGRFGHGFVSAGLSAMLTPNLDTGNAFATGVVRTIAGGVIAEASGGKFLNGAATSAFASAFQGLVGSPGTRSLTPDDYTEAELQSFVDNSPQVAFDLPSFPQWFVDGAAGVGDSLSFGLTRRARSALDISGGIDTGSTAYSVGMYGSMAVGGARLTYAVGLKGIQYVARSIGGQQGAYIASTGRNVMKIIFRGGLFPRFRIYPFSKVAERYGNSWDDIITAAGRSNPLVTPAGIVAGGGAASNKLQLCWQGEPGC